MNAFATKTFQHHTGYVTALLAAAIGLFALTLLTVPGEPPQSALAVLVLINLLLFGAAWEAMKTAVMLSRDTLYVDGIRRKLQIRRRDIEKVTWEKGGGVSVLTKEKKWVRIPHIIGYNSQSMSQTIRAWLNKGLTP